MDSQEDIEKVLDICKKICNSKITQLEWSAEKSLVPTNLIVELRLLINDKRARDKKSKR